MTALFAFVDLHLPAGTPIVDQAKAERVARVPARRSGDPAELGATCAFLCSADARYITGQHIVIDGGALPGAF